MVAYFPALLNTSCSGYGCAEANKFCQYVNFHLNPSGTLSTQKNRQT